MRAIQLIREQIATSDCSACNAFLESVIVELSKSPQPSTLANQDRSNAALDSEGSKK